MRYELTSRMRMEMKITRTTTKKMTMTVRRMNTAPMKKMTLTVRRMNTAPMKKKKKKPRLKPLLSLHPLRS